MIKVVNTKDLTYKEWLAHRQEGIGGSDAGAVAGVNPWSGPIEVYLDKISEEPRVKPLNLSMELGIELEEFVAKKFEEITGKKVRRNNFLLRSDKHPFMQANVDREIVGENAVLECKTASEYAKDDWRDGKMPPHYEIQVLHNIEVGEYDKGYLAALVGKSEFHIREIARDQEAIDYLIKIEQDFWENNVLAKKVPQPDGSNAYDEYLKERFSQSQEDTSMTLDDTIDSKIKSLEEHKALIKELKDEQKILEQQIKATLGDTERGESMNYTVTWKTQISKRLNNSEVKKRLIELGELDKYQYESKSRPLRIKLKREE